MQSNTKDWIQYGSAIAMILSAIILAFLSFFAIQAIEASILWYVA
jgi:large-conductance mechanosensitive channel